MTQRLDIFNLLREIDKKNIQYYTDLAPEERKGFAPVVVQRWLSGTVNKQQVFLLNEICNPYIFSLYKHPDLLYHLMTICTSGHSQKYNWIKATPSNTTNPTCVKIVEEYFNYNTEDAINAIPLISPSDLILMAEELGWQPDEINKARKELGFQTIKNTSRISKNVNIDLIEI